MPDIVFLILKIIGIALLSIVGLALILIAVVLFVPIRYQINVSVDKEKTEKVKASAKITWLLHLLNAVADYPSEEIIKVRISLFTVYPKKEKSEPQWAQEDSGDNDKPESASPGASALPENNAADETLKEPEANDSATTQDLNQMAAADASEDYQTKALEDTLQDAVSDADIPKKKKRNIFSIFFNKCKEILIRIKDTIKDIIAKILNVKENAAYYLNVISSNTFHHSLSLCKNELFKILKKLKPKTIKGHISFGAEEPSSTAQVFGLYTVLRPVLGNKFYFYPSMQEPMLEGEIFMKGHLRLVTLLSAGIRIYFNKDIKRTIKLLKKES